MTLKNFTKASLILILLCSLVYAQEEVFDFQDNDRARLNEGIRRIDRRLDELEADHTHSLTTDTTGILSTLRGGTGQDFSDATKDSMLYFRETGVMALTPASTRVGNRFLQDDFTFQSIVIDNAFKFIETGTFNTNTAFTITETISDDDVFLILIDFDAGTNDNFVIRVNSASGVSDYSYFFAAHHENSGIQHEGSDTTGSGIQFVGANQSSGGNDFMSVYIRARNSDTQLRFRYSSGNALYESIGGGIYNKGTPTTIDFECDATCPTIVGRYYLFQLNQS